MDTVAINFSIMYRTFLKRLVSPVLKSGCERTFIEAFVLLSLHFSYLIPYRRKRATRSTNGVETPHNGHIPVF